MVILNAKTTFDQILFKIVPNPTIQLKSESGIIMNSGLHQSQETGGFEKADEMIGFGVITAVGETKYVEVGDYIFYYRGSIRPVPLGEEIWQVSERNVMAYVKKDDPTLEAAFADYDSQMAVQEQELKKVAHKLDLIM